MIALTQTKARPKIAAIIGRALGNARKIRHVFARALPILRLFPARAGV